MKILVTVAGLVFFALSLLATWALLAAAMAVECVVLVLALGIRWLQGLKAIWSDCFRKVAALWTT